MAGGFAAVGTIGAVGVALRQVARERASRIKREQQDQSDRHRAHASLISAWLGDPEQVPHSERREYENPTDDRTYNWRTPIYIHNSSSEPIYEVVSGIVFIQGAGPRTLEGILDLRQERRRDVIERQTKGTDVEKEAYAFGRDPVMTTGIIPPGTWRVWIQGKGWTSILSGRGGVDVAFVDRNGTSWVRRAMGPLEELNERPLAHFQPHGLHGPHEFHPPERVD